MDLYLANERDFFHLDDGPKGLEMLRAVRGCLELIPNGSGVTFQNDTQVILGRCGHGAYGISVACPAGQLVEVMPLCLLGEHCVVANHEEVQFVLEMAIARISSEPACAPLREPEREPEREREREPEREPDEEPADFDVQRPYEDGDEMSESDSEPERSEDESDGLPDSWSDWASPDLWSPEEEEELARIARYMAEE
jgi:hypothetical protein